MFSKDKKKQLLEKKKIAIFTVVFPKISNYLNDFFLSLTNQTYKNFDLLIINDRLENFKDYKNKYNSLNIIDINLSLSPAKIREYGLKMLHDRGYDIVIFSDADDFYKENRIEEVLKYFDDYDIVVNDLNIVDNKGKIIENNYLSNRLKNNENIFIDHIKEKNFMGLSNTAIKGDIIDSLIFNDDLVAVDWYIFSCLLIKGYKAIFTNKTSTYYRQHKENTIGINRIKKRFIKKGLSVKDMNYKLLSQIDDRYSSYYETFHNLKLKLANDKLLVEYINYIKSKNINHPLWWEQIQKWD